MDTRWPKAYFVVMAMLLSPVFASTTNAIQLPAETKVQIVFVADVSSKYVKPNEFVEIRLVGAVDVGGIIVVEDGARGAARIKSVKPAGKGGKPGRVEVDLVELEPKGAYKTEGDKKIALEAVGGPITAEGKSRKFWNYVFGLGLLFVKGTEGVIPADKPFPAKIAEDIMLVK
jgi:hypothetical protein